MDPEVRSTGANPAMSPLFRRITIVEGFVLAVAGILPFFFPHTALREWPWVTGPFNIRFIGAVYLTSLTAVLVLLSSFRWAPGRVALPMLAVFTNLVLVVSLVYVDRFDFGRFSTWAWFFLYVLIPASANYHLWRYRRLPPAQPAPVTAAWRAFFLGTGALFGAYGIALLAAPDSLTGFWPWEIDAFHGRLYSAIFLTLGVAALTVSRVAARIERMIVALTMIALGLFSIVGLAIADAAENAVDWSSAGTLLWVGAFGVLVVAGTGLALGSRGHRASRAPV